MNVPDDAAPNSQKPPDETASVADASCVEGAGRRCNPPAPTVAKIVIDGSASGPQEKQADGLFFRVALDKGGEVDSSFTGVFLDDKGPIAGPEFRVKQRSGRVLVCVLKGHDQLPSTRVRVYEPGAR